MTQLLLEQSLRMRVKVEAPSDSTSTPRNTSSSGPDLPPTSSTTETRKNHSNSAENLLGKINNLVSSDLDTIVQGTDIFALCKSSGYLISASRSIARNSSFYSLTNNFFDDFLVSGPRMEVSI